MKAFEFLMSTKEGKALLANYAMKGQTIAGFSFSKDGNTIIKELIYRLGQVYVMQAFRVLLLFL